jgi:hypothetical protein
MVSTGKSAWESNPPTKLVTPFARFEDEDSHRTTCALVTYCNKNNVCFWAPNYEFLASVQYLRQFKPLGRDDWWDGRLA